LFLYGLTQEKQVADPNLLKNRDYLWSKAKLWTEALGAINAVDLALDVGERATGAYFGL